MLSFSGERIVPEADNCEPLFALKMYQEHIARYLFASQKVGGKAVLDIGCGVGYGSQLLSLRGAANVTAFDISPEAVQHAQRYYAHPNLRFLVASAEGFSFRQEFDVVTCFELIEHVDHQHQVIQRIAQVLKPDGLLFISTPRPSGKPRSAFHVRELSHLDLSNLLNSYFPHIEWFVENNHFASLVTGAAPGNLRKIEKLHSQFGLGEADYLIAVASRSALDGASFEAQLVLNNDAYVRNLERDVAILHGVQRDLQEQLRVTRTEELNALRAREGELVAVSERLRAEVGHITQQLQAHEREEMRARKGVAYLETELRRQNQRSKRELAALVGDLANARETIQSLEQTRASLEAQIGEWRAHAGRMEARAGTYAAEMNAMATSRSWRITAPIRGLTHAIRGKSSDDRSDAAKPAAIETATEPEAATAIADVQGGANGFRIPSRPEFDVVYIIGCPDGESKRYRVHNLMHALNGLGYRAECWPQPDIRNLVAEQFSARTVVLFRCAYDQHIERLLEYCGENQIDSIFDIDDLVFEPESIGFVRALNTFGPEALAEYICGVEGYRKTLLACNRATCPTAFLAGRIAALGKRADVIPNSINDRQIEIAQGLRAGSETKRKDVRIGYFSGSHTHQVDFEACEPALLALMERRPETRFVLVGALELRASWKRFSHRIEKHPMVPYDHMLSLLAGVDINLAPLELGNPYCEAKSQLKIFEAGLVGVPTIASATGSNSEAIRHGHDGFLATTTQDWVRSLDELARSPELRRSVGERAEARALAQFGPQVAARRLVEVYNLGVAERPEGHGYDRLKITWLVPGLLIGGGGHRNILRAAYYLEQFGHEIELYFTKTDLSAEELSDAVREHFYPLQCAMHRYEGSINPTDVLFATHWSTVDAAMRARTMAREIMYFVQDFEPAFAPMGSEYILAENTYRLGLYHITSGPWCEAVLKRDYGCEADHFVFPVDREVYHPRPRNKREKNVLFFAKPEMPRRCFELGTMALEHFHLLRPDVEIILFGSGHVHPASLTFPATVHAILPTIQDLAQLYADADVGIVFSTTNPSLVPYEMMACGLPVVDLGRPGNEINYGGRFEIALLTDPEPAEIARGLRDLLESPEELIARARRGLEFVQMFPSEEEMARRVEELILKRMAARKRQTAAGDQQSDTAGETAPMVQLAARGN